MIDKFDCKYFRYDEEKGMYCSKGYANCLTSCYESSLDLSDEDKAAKTAYYIFSGVIILRQKLEENILLLGFYLKTIRDKKLYRYLDCSSFSEFLGQPEISIRRSTAYSFIRIYELYSQRLNINPETIKQIGHGKLQIIEPVVERNPDYWINKALVLSRADLRREVNEELGKPEPEIKRAEPEVDMDIPNNYLDYVKNHGCIFHPERRVDRAHFPKTRAAGAPNDWVIPLCRECHQHYHDLGVISFFEAYRNQVMGYFYETINLLFEKLREKNK